MWPCIDLRCTEASAGAEFVQYSLGTNIAHEAASMTRDALADFEKRKSDAEVEIGVYSWEKRAKRTPDSRIFLKRPSIKHIELATDEFYREYIRYHTL